MENSYMVFTGDLRKQPTKPKRYNVVWFVAKGFESGNESETGGGEFHLIDWYFNKSKLQKTNISDIVIRKSHQTEYFCGRQISKSHYPLDPTFLSFETRVFPDIYQNLNYCQDCLDKLNEKYPFKNESYEIQFKNSRNLRK